MALDVTADPHPNFAYVASAGTTATQIRCQPYSEVQIFASGAIYVFNDVADGGTVAAITERLAVTATQAASGYAIVIGGPIPGQDYGTVCVAAQSGTVNITAVSVPPKAPAP